MTKLKKIICMLRDDFRELSFLRFRLRFILRIKRAYSGFVQVSNFASHIHDAKMQKLCAKTRDLRSELPQKTSWSILIALSETNAAQLERVVFSCLPQMVAGDEIILGLSKNASQVLSEKISKLHARALESSLELRLYCFPDSESDLRALIDQAKNEKLLLIDQKGWLRPDALYRFEQAFSAEKSRRLLGLYCDENEIDEKGAFIIGSILQKPSQYEFPFVFSNIVSNCLACSRSEVKARVFTSAINSVFDLCLTLESAGVQLKGVPLVLFSKTKNESAPSNLNLKNSLQAYFSKKGHALILSDGLTASSVRPQLKSDQNLGVIVVVPFHNQLEMTKRCLERLNKLRTEQKIHIIAVNNRSKSDLDLGTLKNLSDQWITADFPFNYSRLNNLAVKECSATEEAYPYVLFLNNDVILNEGALIEMSAWLKNFARIGIVGARLFYPNGLIQHGGIAHTRDSTLTENQWEHLDAKRTPESAKLSSTVLLTDAVTAACAMMRRSDFHKIGGFDEVLYPVAYSDTDLCSRLRKNLNQLCLMTPYAEGIHHESLSRGKNDIEDYEASGSLTRTLGLELPSVTPRYT